MDRQRTLGLVAAIAALTGSFTIASMSPAAAAAATRYVAMTGSDSSDCTDSTQPCATIQYAINQAAAGDTVSIGPGTFGQSATVTIPLSIVGAGADQTTVTGDQVSGDTSLTVDGTGSPSTPTVSVSDLALNDNSDSDGLFIAAANVQIKDVDANDNDANGAQVTAGGSLQATDVELSHNSDGFLLETGGSLTAEACTMTGNSVSGLDAEVQSSARISDCDISQSGDDGVYVFGGGDTTTVSVSRSTLDQNLDAGLYVDSGGSADVSRSTISGSTPRPSDAGFGGGAYVARTGSLSLSDSTIAANTNFGVAEANGGEVEVDNSTVTATHAGGGAAGLSGGLVVGPVSPDIATTPAVALGLTVVGTIVANNEVPDCSGAITDGGYNLETEPSCGFTATGSFDAPDPQLGALADNGGPTKTVLPGVSSPARNAIPVGAAGCVAGATDQRGEPRPDAVTHRCDVGSVEAQVVNPKLTAIVSATHGKRHGWYRGKVSVRFHCTVGSAPLVAGCPPALRTAKSGKHHVVRTIHALDAGKASVSRRFKVDNTKPKVRVFLKHGKAHVKCRDRFSGVASCHVRSHEVGSKLRYVATAHDKAGNVRHKRGKLTLG